MDLKGRKVVVTGASGRLGMRVVRAFLRASAEVVGVVLNREEEMTLRDDSPEVGTVLRADLTDEPDVRECFSEIEKAVGKPDAVVHLVGGWGGGPFAETTLEEWNRLIAMNLTSAFLCFREAVRLMGDGGGHLLAISSKQGADGGFAEQAPYSAAKGGLIRLMESISEELSAKGIRTTIVAPSMLIFDDAKGDGVSADAIADLCVFACSETGDQLNPDLIRAYGSF